MKRPLITPLLGILLIIALSLSAYFGFKTYQLSAQLEANRSFINDLDEQMAEQKELKEIDAMLVDGNYTEALNAYEAQYQKEAIKDGPSIEMRVALIKELLRLRYENQMAALQSEKEEEIDSALLAMGPRPQDIRQSDSLTFALEKARVQINYLKKQLNNKSFGEYLKFTNSKGSQMHYVGQVKNGKANGYGVALLNTGSRYEGQWKDNMRHGVGTYYWSDGQYYVGEYKNDKRNGQGTYYWPNGERYAGQWEDDERDGKGVFYGKDGQVIADGTWEDDKLEESVKPSKGKSGS